MPRDIAFFLAPDDEKAKKAAPDLRGPGEAFEPVPCLYISPDSAISLWDMYFHEPSIGLAPDEVPPAWSSPEWVTPPTNDGVELFALPQHLTRALAGASSAELSELTGIWIRRVRSEDGDDMSDDELRAALQAVARLAASAVNTGGRLYSWSF